MHTLALPQYLHFEFFAGQLADLSWQPFGLNWNGPGFLPVAVGS